MGKEHDRWTAPQNESALGMIQKIADKFKNSNLSWQIRWARKQSHQSFLAKGTTECRRLVETEACLISIYKKNAVGKLGMSSFKITPANLANFDKEFEQAVFAAELVNNEPFELPESPKQLPNVLLRDENIDAATPKQCEEKLLAAIAKEKGIRLSSAEFFIDQIETRLVNHKGLDVSQNETLLETEFILLARTGTKENEYINRYKRRFLEDFDLEREVTQSARFARDATAAALPKTGTFPVVLSDEPLDGLFNPLIARASARLKYNKMMQSDLGQSVVEDGPIKGDSITLWSNGVIDRAVGSSAFDSYGTPTNRVRLINRNKLEAYLSDQRYSDYLKVPVTGELGNTEVESGSTPFQTLLDPEIGEGKPIYHLQAFSAFEPNAITGAFSAEIRAGYEISNKGVRPIKGGSVSGVLQRNLLECTLSKERTQRERALVPQGILFANLTIAGE